MENHFHDDSIFKYAIFPEWMNAFPKFPIDNLKDKLIREFK